MRQERDSRFFPLAASCRARLCLVLIWLAWLPAVHASRTHRDLSPEQLTWQTSPQETRVGGPLPTGSVRLFSEGFLKLAIATGYAGCGYEIVSGRRQWPNRDPIGIEGGINLYAYVHNGPVNAIDPYGELTTLDVSLWQRIMFGLKGFLFPSLVVANPVVGGAAIGTAVLSAGTITAGDGTLTGNIGKLLAPGQYVGPDGKIHNADGSLASDQVNALNPVNASTIPNFQKIVSNIQSPGRFNVTVDTAEQALQLIRAAMPDAVQLPDAVAGQPYPNPPTGVKNWYQIQPAEPGVGNDLPHIKYVDWTGGKKDTGGSWGHIFFGP